MLETLHLDKTRDTCQPRPHLYRQGFDLRLDLLVESLNYPGHGSVYQK